MWLTLLISSHWSMQEGWKQCPQGKTLTETFSSNSQRQTVHLRKQGSSSESFRCVCLSTVHLQNRSPLVLSTSEWGGRWRSMDWVLYWRCRRSRWVLGAPRKSCCRGPTYHRSNTRPKMTGLYRRRRKDEEHEWTQTTPPELADVVHSSQDCHTSHQNLI